MPLESASQPYQLVPTNPPSGDAAKQGHLHLQLIKQMMLLGYLGQVDSITAVRALTAPVGATFMHNNGFYQINENFYGSTPLENTSKMINLNNGRKAYRIDNRFWFGPHQGIDVIKPQNATSFRYPVVVHLKGTPTTFPIAEATAAVPGGVPVVGDIVEYMTDSGAIRLTEAAYWNGAVWQKVPNEINGTSHHFGLFSSSRVQTTDVLATRARLQAFELVGAVRMEVRNPDGFGPDNLVYWLGLIEGKLLGNGDVNYAVLTKLNALRWQGVSTAGGVVEGDGGDGGTEPTIPTTGGVVPDAFGMGTAYTSLWETYGDFEASGSCGFFIDKNGSITFDYPGMLFTGSPQSGKYVTDQFPTVGNLYEIQVTLNSGVMTEGLTSGFVPLSTSRFVRVLPQATPEARNQTLTGSVTITIREIAVPANTKSLTVSFSGTAVCNPGFLE